MTLGGLLFVTNPTYKSFKTMMSEHVKRAKKDTLGDNAVVNFFFGEAVSKALKGAVQHEVNDYVFFSLGSWTCTVNNEPPRVITYIGLFNTWLCIDAPKKII